MGSCFKVNEAATVTKVSLNLSQIHNDNFQDPVFIYKWHFLKSS